MRSLFMTIFYWLSDLAVALWIGGVVGVALSLRRLSSAFSADASPEVLARVAGFSVGMADALRPLVIAAALVLIASVVLSAVLERAGRARVGWWVLWLWRSIAILAMVAVALYASGETKSAFEQVEDAVHALVPSAADTAVTARPVPHPDALAPLLQAFRARYTKWVQIEVILGALVLLAGAVKQARWGIRVREQVQYPHGEPSPEEMGETEAPSPE